MEYGGHATALDPKIKNFEFQMKNRKGLLPSFFCPVPATGERFTTETLGSQSLIQKNLCVLCASAVNPFGFNFSFEI
jgi:hypothetical protein